MCGLVSVFSYSGNDGAVDIEEIIRIRDHMNRRGPDGSGIWVSTCGRIGLGHRRLKIIDLSESAAQPMSKLNGAVQIVFNGEIYNYRQLRKTLEENGHVFSSQSDTEVVLALYIEYGREFVSLLQGMYAFSIWDERKKGMLLGRDPFGIKPLYIADNGHTLRAASQVKALVSGGKVNTSKDAAGQVGFFLLGSVPEPFTLYKGIKAFPSGSTMWVDKSGVEEPRVFFDLTKTVCEIESASHEEKINHDLAREKFKSVLEDSIFRHLVADVPVGVFLSSGLDSATLASFAASNGDSNIKAITAGFHEYKGTELDEVPLARHAAEKFLIPHEVVWASETDFENILAAMDQPSFDGINTYFISKCASSVGAKVALSGLGGDELLAGYPSFNQLPHLVRTLQLFGSPGRTIGTWLRKCISPILNKSISPKYASLLELGGKMSSAYFLRKALHMPWELDLLLDKDLIEEGSSALSLEERIAQTISGVKNTRLQVSLLEYQWFMKNQLLRDADWASMAHSLEIRVPLVDEELFKCVASMVSHGISIRKQDMALCSPIGLPDDMLFRKKTGFTIPVREWLSKGQPMNEKDRGLRGWSKHVFSHF